MTIHSCVRIFFIHHRLGAIFQKSRRSEDWLQGRTDGGVRVNFPKMDDGDDIAKGDYVVVEITESNSQGLKGSAGKKSSIAEFDDLARSERIVRTISKSCKI